MKSLFNFTIFKYIYKSEKQQSEDQKQIDKLSEEYKNAVGQLEEVKDIIKNQFKDLTLNMTQDQSKKLVQTMGDLKSSLGDMNRLRIDKVANEDASLNNFIANCCPSSLKLFAFNDTFAGNSGENPIKIKFYLDSLSKVFPKVTKEIYMEHLIIDEADLNKIVTLASTAERLVLDFCKIRLFV